MGGGNHRDAGDCRPFGTFPSSRCWRTVSRQETGLFARGNNSISSAISRASAAGSVVAVSLRIEVACLHDGTLYVSSAHRARPVLGDRSKRCGSLGAVPAGWTADRASFAYFVMLPMELRCRTPGHPRYRSEGLWRRWWCRTDLAGNDQKRQAVLPAPRTPVRVFVPPGPLVRIQPPGGRSGGHRILLHRTGLFMGLKYLWIRSFKATRVQMLAPPPTTANTSVIRFSTNRSIMSPLLFSARLIPPCQSMCFAMPSPAAEIVGSHVLQQSLVAGGIGLVNPSLRISIPGNSPSITYDLSDGFQSCPMSGADM
jgi:hypothetical protein